METHRLYRIEHEFNGDGIFAPEYGAEDILEGDDLDLFWKLWGEFPCGYTQDMLIRKKIGDHPENEFFFGFNTFEELLEMNPYSILMQLVNVGNFRVYEIDCLTCYRSERQCIFIKEDITSQKDITDLTLSTLKNQVHEQLTGTLQD